MESPTINIESMEPMLSEKQGWINNRNPTLRSMAITPKQDSMSLM
jgi:hypothetical protein